MNILPSPQKSSPVDTEAQPPLISGEIPGRWHVLSPAIALLGGIFGIIGAIYTELTRGGFLVAFVGAPIIEESLKPFGVYLLLAKWPRALRGRLYTAGLSALGGLAFALIENLFYLKLHFPEADPRLVLWRFTVGLSLHTVASFIFGFGINEKLAASVRGEIKFLSTGKRYFIAAIVLHSLYNILTTIFAGKLGLG